MGQLSPELYPEPSFHSDRVLGSWLTMFLFVWLLMFDTFSNTVPFFTKFKLPRAISQETAIYPCWNSSLDSRGDPIRALLYRTHQGCQALQSFALWASLPTGYCIETEDCIPTSLNKFAHAVSWTFIALDLEHTEVATWTKSRQLFKLFVNLTLVLWIVPCEQHLPLLLAYLLSNKHFTFITWYHT